MKAALESRLNAKIPMNHAIMTWMVEHSAQLLTKYMRGPDGRTGYGRLHGKEVTERICEFGERILYYVPRKMRSKMDPRWRYGVFVGRSMNSDQNYIALTDGSITTARAMVRLVPSARWSTRYVENLIATPFNLKIKKLELIEEHEDPHANADAPKVDDSLPAEEEYKRALSRLKIMPTDLKKYGYSDQCPKCDAYRAKHPDRARVLKHTEVCRTRIYKAMLEDESSKARMAVQQKRINVDEPTRADDLAPPKEHDGMMPEILEIPDAVEVDHMPSERQDVIHNKDDDEDRMENEDDVAEVFGDFSEEDANMDDHEHESDPMVSSCMKALADNLQVLGVEPENAVGYASSVVRKSRKIGFMEVYGRGGFVEANRMLPSLNIEGLAALDLATLKPSGQPWNFSLSSDRKLAMRIWEDLAPDWVILSPPCTWFSMINHNLNVPKMDPVKVAKMMKEARKHLSFAASMAERQLRAGKHFLFEHPFTAKSWKEPCIQRLLRRPNVCTVKSDQCMFGCVAKTSSGQQLPARKSTRFMTSSVKMAQRLDIQCDRNHTHIPLNGKNLANASFYPEQLRLAVLRGMRDQADMEDRNEPNIDDERNLAEVRAYQCRSDLAKSVAALCAEAHKMKEELPVVADFKLRDGTVRKVDLSATMKSKYVDEYTREELPLAQVRDAIADELSWLNDEVWEGSWKHDVDLEDDAIVVGTRWVACNKGDQENPDVRMRLVAQEVNTYHEEAYFAATPPIECKRALMSEYATRRTFKGKPLKMSFVDVRKAYFHGRPTRNLYVRLPPELGLPRTMLGKLKRCLYGTRDAGHIWESVYGEALVSMGFKQGKASPCCFEHEDWGISLVVHGDDFTALGCDSSLDKWEKAMADKFEIKLKGRIGHEDHDLKEMRLLNRIIRVVPEGLTYEADPRHVELLVRSLGLEDCRKVSTPGVKPQLEVELEGADDTIDNVIASLCPTRSRSACVKFDGNPEIVNVKAYSSIYGLHPRGFVIDVDADGCTFVKRLKEYRDPFTGIHVDRLKRRVAQIHRDSAARRKVLRKVLVNGSAWEPSIESLIAAVSKKNKFQQKRMGTKAVKAAERLADTSGELVGESATMYRALSARINYLSIDRPDLAYTAKELCRDFAHPTSKSVERLKRAVRYLCHKPRVVYRYDFQDPVDSLTAYVDTDFAGCLETRRSTSGGAIFQGAHLLYHWSQTQTTIALSSAEAELSGICKGASKGIGLRSTLADLGIHRGLEIKSDAAAAIGICKRRGLGKVRHLSVADLWVQDHIRTGDFVLNKVEGPKNPSDILTKYVDRITLERHFTTMGLDCLEGRAKSALKVDA